MTVEATAAATPFDFRKPARLAGDVAGHLEAWQQAICTLAPEKWADCLVYAVQCQVASLETAALNQAREMFPDPALGYYVSVETAESPMLFVFERPLGLAFAAGMVGDPVEQLPEDRELTTLEQSLFDMAVVALVEVLNQSQPGTDAVTCRLGQHEPRPQRTKELPADKDLVITRFEISGPFGSQNCWWLLSEELLESLSHTSEPASVAPTRQHHLEEVVGELPVELVVRLGGASLDVKDLANLRAGDIILLDQRVSEPLVVDVQGKEKFRAWPGRIGGRQAFRIVSPS